MLVAIIPVKSIESARALIQQADGADVFEFRLDYLSQMDLLGIKKLQEMAQKPVLFTLRKLEQGGVYSGDENARLQAIEQLITLAPEYLDIEHDVPLGFCRKLKEVSPGTKLICSYHNFVNTPSDLSGLLNSLLNPVFDVYKIITTAESILDTLRVLHFVKQNSDQYQLISHAMAEVGVVSRILGKIFGNYFTYATVDPENIAPGLLALEELTSIYHYQHLNAKTKIYGLIGDPIKQSIGHLYHNAEFIAHQQNAVYVKFHVKTEELADFFAEIKDLPIEGISVTMPHKQTVLKFCDSVTQAVQAIGAANTLIKQKAGYLAANTDGDAVVSLLPNELKNKKVIVLGAGGAAMSIIYALKQAGADVLVYNRTFNAALKTLPLNEVKHADYDILINTIPAKYYQQDVRFIKDKIVFDANYQATPTELILDALLKGCICIEGQAMFYAQAKLQRQLWFA
jgi:3-dehydroquinate dehydratase / shikimate dehydrogenase